MARPNKDQHTIPKTYLQGFTDFQGILWVADENLKVFSRKPDQILTERDYYTIKFPSGGGTLAIETKYLNGIEGSYATIFKNTIAKKKQLNKEEKAKISVFIASMLERQSNSRDALKKFFNDAEEMIKHLRGLPDHVKKRASTFPIASGGGPTISADELLEMGKDVGSLHSSLIPDTVADIAPIIFDMRWVFMVRPQNADPFITSNNPCIMVNPVAENEIGRGRMGSLPGLIQNDVELTLPLSSDIAVMTGWQAKFDCVFTEISLELVNEINSRTRRQAKTILGSDKSMLERIVMRTKAYHLAK